MTGYPKVTTILKKGSTHMGKLQETFVTYRKAPDWWVTRNANSRGERRSGGFDGQTHWVLLPKPDLAVLGGYDGPIPISVEFQIRPYKKLKLRGVKKVQGRSSFVVELEDDTVRRTHYVDAESFLLLRVDSETAFRFHGPRVGGSLRDSEFQWTARSVTYYSDWREVDGLKLPFELRGTDLGRKSITRISEYQLNLEVDDLVFLPPPGSRRLSR